MQEPAPLPPLIELDELAHRAGPALRRRLLCEVRVGGRLLPVHAYLLGSSSPQAPAVAFVGGVHGLERIGAEVVIAYLRSLVRRLHWDNLLHRQLESVRMVFMPIVNPAGMWRGTRANPNGVDLMRNAPLSSTEQVPFLLGGQRISARLPWYRGAKGAPMEPENQAVCRVVEQELHGRSFSVAVDCIATRRGSCDGRGNSGVSRSAGTNSQAA